MTKLVEVANTSLSTRAKHALASNGIHTIQELQSLYREAGERHIRERMFGIGKVTAEEVLEFLGTQSHAGVSDVERSA